MADNLTLQSNTGQNDKSGSWFSGLLQTAEQGVATYRQLTQRPQTAAPSTPVVNVTAPATNYTPWLIGGGVVVALVLVVVLVKH